MIYVMLYIKLNQTRSSRVTQVINTISKSSLIKLRLIALSSCDGYTFIITTGIKENAAIERQWFR